MMSKMDEKYTNFLTKQREYDEEVRERQLQHELQIQEKQDKLFLEVVKILKSTDK